MSSRRRPLHTSGVAILLIAHIAHTRSQDFSGPLGSLIRKILRLTEFARPLVYALQYQLLAILSFGDDLILAIEDRIETIFPPSKYVFNATDKLIEVTETFPGKLEDAIKEFLVIIHQYSLLDWAVNQFISWLNYWISMLMHREFGHAKEKEIRVDINSKECNYESQSGGQSAESESSPPNNRPQSSVSDTGNVDMVIANKEAVKDSYKEVLLEKGKGNEGRMQETSGSKEKEDVAKMEEETQRQDVAVDEERNAGEASTSKSDESSSNHDQILELFESGWLMTPPKEPKKPGWLKHSVSYTK